MWREAGLIRDAVGLGRLAAGRRIFSRGLIAKCALAREESRGGHFRIDFPFESEAFARHSVLGAGDEPWSSRQWR